MLYSMVNNYLYPDHDGMHMVLSHWLYNIVCLFSDTLLLIPGNLYVFPHAKNSVRHLRNIPKGHFYIWFIR